MGRGRRETGCHRPLQTLRHATAAYKWDTGDKHEGLQQADEREAGDTLGLSEASLQRVPLRPRALRLPRCGPAKGAPDPSLTGQRGSLFFFFLQQPTLLSTPPAKLWERS